MYSKQEWEKLIATKYKNRCIICMQPYDTIHEIIPKSQRPKTWQTKDNCIPVCNKCHTMIHAAGAKTYVMTLRGLQKQRIKDFGTQISKNN